MYVCKQLIQKRFMYAWARWIRESFKAFAGFDKISTGLATARARAMAMAMAMATAMAVAMAMVTTISTAMAMAMAMEIHNMDLLDKISMAELLTYMNLIISTGIPVCDVHVSN